MVSAEEIASRYPVGDYVPTSNTYPVDDGSNCDDPVEYEDYVDHNYTSGEDFKGWSLLSS